MYVKAYSIQWTQINLRFILKLKGSNCSDSFAFNYEPNKILFGSYTKGKLSNGLRVYVVPVKT